MKYFCLYLTVVGFSLTCFSQEDSLKKNIGDLSLEELLNLNVYSASKKVETIKNAPAILTLINRNEIESYGALTIIDVLKYVPCLEVSLGSDGVYQVAIRGSRKEGNILVLLNGQQMNDFYSGGAVFDLPAKMVEKIEVIRGPGSALFGTNAMSGVINIFTVKESSASVSVGPFSNLDANAAYNYEKKEVEFNLNIGYSQNNTNNQSIFKDKASSSPWSLTYDSTAFKTNRTNKDLYVNTSLQIENLQLQFNHLRREYGSYVGSTFIASPDSKTIRNQSLATILYNYKVGENVIITPKLYTQLNSLNALNQEAPPNYVSVENDTFANGKLVRENYQGSSIGGEISIYIKANEHFDFLTGSVYEDLRINKYNLERNFMIVGDVYKGTFGNYDDIQFDQLGKTRKVFAYYMQTNFKYDKLNVTAGLRYDDYSDFGQALNPRIGVNYSINNNFRIKGLAGKAFRAPTFKELYDNTSIGNEYGVQGNDKLSNENITTYELGFEYNRKNFILRYNIFYSANNNLIRVYDPHGGGGIGKYQNIGNTKLFGHEAEILFKINSFLSFNANFSHFVNYFEYQEENVSPADYYFFSQQEKYNTELRNTPTFKLNSGLTLRKEKFTIFMGSNFGNRCENNKRFFLEKNHYVDIPYYLLGSFNLMYQCTKKFQIGISANNIGVKYSDPDESTNINAFGELGLIQPKAMYLLNLKYSFK